MEFGPLLYALLSVTLLYFIISLPSGLYRQKLRHIPTVGGPSLPIISYYGAFRFLFHAREIMQEGYAKYKGGIFKFSELGHWRVIVTGPKLVDEFRRAPESVLSSSEALREMIGLDYTLGLGMIHDPYHVQVIRSRLKGDLGSSFHEVRDEIVASLNDELRSGSDGNWSRVPVMKMAYEVVCRASNRLFIGLPICRDPDYCALNKSFARDITACAKVFRITPKFLKPVVARLLPDVSKGIDRGVRHLEPIISKRLRMLEDLGDEWTDRPNDMLQWLIEAARGEERTVRALVIRVLAVNLAALHTTAVSLTMALFYLAAFPQYIGPLRDEVENVVREHGWTKAGLDQMNMVDSFLREVMRASGMSTGTMSRIALKDYTFSDGTFIPAGTHLMTPSGPIFADDTVYPGASEFNPWRFSEMGDQGDHVKLVNTNVNFLSFGHGGHACPGRFFASIKMKMVLAHIVMNYDVKMEREGVIPRSTRIGHICVPSTRAEMLFQQRSPHSRA
ncbi:uncharacterized protein FIBRA_08450 [Fibroporia radiculosa]|uniref:Cytochrome P450 n=1 Tax=Fibroporia radiculosa TaxID=599839 RepID=J4ICD2_9APHY|nr:uncharacterized protein FIBRA_08450 [Fibroporia radiculosa]CCM06206.1 predicted protein [Fibroporia radiculosa]